MKWFDPATPPSREHSACYPYANPSKRERVCDLLWDRNIYKQEGRERCINREKWVDNEIEEEREIFTRERETEWETG